MTSKNNFIGKWRITSMSSWDKEYFDEEVPAYIKIEKNLMGDFHFGYVQGQMDGRITKHQDENHTEGEIKFHFGDDSTFQLKRMK